MKSLVSQAQHLELNLVLYGQPMKLSEDCGGMFILLVLVIILAAVFCVL